MNNLNEKMQERLEKWRRSTLAVPAANIFKGKKERDSFRFVGKNDYGDANSLEELEEEHRRSQTRR